MNIGCSPGPAIVPQVNLAEIGRIIDLPGTDAAGQGIHFQPVSYFGRIPSAAPDEDRATLADIVKEIEIQTRVR